MPELPEVETIKEDLQELVLGATIERAQVLHNSLVENATPAEFAFRLEGCGIVGARRRGKNLVLDLNSGDSVVVQLKIGGQLLLVPPVETPTTSIMLILSLDGERQLYLRDETGFTRTRILSAAEFEAWSGTLGPEPFSEEFSVEYLRGELSSRRARIKPLVLDQSVV
ncbi:MAG: hypothetical protein M3475_09280, partial [Actinomycetota bacterium]|nr:hypothetical protein [Actinomycetota bacterium]